MAGFSGARGMARLVGGAVLALGLALPAARAETLNTVLADAYRNSNLLEQNRALLRAADEDVAGAVATLRPVLDFIANAAFDEPARGSDSVTGSLQLAASLTLFDGGARSLGLEAARETVLAARADLLDIEQQVLLGAVEAYLDMRSARQAVALRQSNVRLIEQELQAAQDRFAVGEVTRTDVSQAEARLSAARSGLAAAEGQLASARESFRLAVGRYPGGSDAVPGAPRLPAALDAARAVATRTHPAIVSAQHNVRVAELGVARAEAARGARVTGSASLALDDGGDDASSLGLRLSKPLYSGGALRADVRQAVAREQAARAALLQTVRRIEQQVGISWSNLQVARAQLEATERQITAAQLAFEGIQEEARLGARTTLDVLDAEQELLDARNARVEAEATRFLAFYGLLSSMGRLTVTDLGLGIPTYDPAAYYEAVKSAPPISTQGGQLDKLLKSIGRN